MPNERTLVFLKPCALPRRIVGEVVSRLERKGLQIVAAKLLRMPRSQAERHYAEHAGKDFYEGLVDYMSSGPIFAMVLEGEGAVAAVRKLCGATRPEDALPGTIRGDLAMHTSRNVIHSSDSIASAEREIAIFFSPEEIVPWPDSSGCWI